MSKSMREGGAGDGDQEMKAQDEQEETKGRAEGEKSEEAKVQERAGCAILEDSLRWRHMAPTAPDTLACYPFYIEDPFILSETPVKH